MHLIIAGIPGTGKSTFSRWLVDKHGYVRCPTGEEPGTTFLDDIYAARKASEKVVIDWGFPVGMLDTVRSLIGTGVQHWWFDGDRDAALESFLARTGHPGRKNEWDVQLQNIEENWGEIAATFEGRILDVISPGPLFLSHEDLWGTIKGHEVTPSPSEIEAP